MATTLTVMFQAVSLRPLTTTDAESAVQWAADEVFCAAINWTPHLEPDRVRGHWLGLIVSPPANLLRLGLTWQGRLIGYVDFNHIDAQTVELGYAIGERDLWGQGIGSAACKLALSKAFDELGYHVALAEAHESNERSRRLLLKLGFVWDGYGATEEYQGKSERLLRYRLTRSGF